MITLQNPDHPDVNFSTSVEDTTFNIRQRWNGTSASWVFDFLTSEGQVIQRGCKGLQRLPLVTRKRHLLPDGNFYVMPFTATTLQVGRDNFGPSKAFRLIWATSEEVAAQGN